MSRFSTFYLVALCSVTSLFLAQASHAQTETAVEGAELRLEPAKIKTLRLRDLNLPPDLVVSENSRGDLDDGTPELHLDKGLLYVATPGDTGKGQNFDIILETPTGDVRTLVVQVETLQNVFLDAYCDNCDDIESSPKLTMTGIGADGIPEDETLTLGWTSDTLLSADKSMFMATLLPTYEHVKLQDLFVYDIFTNTFSASVEAILDRLIKSEPHLYRYGLSVSLMDEKAYGGSYSLTFIRPTVTLYGQLVSNEIKAISGPDIAELNMSLQGKDNPLRKVASVDTNGQFVFNDLLASESYDLHVVDLGNISGWRGVNVLADSTEVFVTMYHGSDADKAPNCKETSNGARACSHGLSAPAIRQNGTQRRVRRR